MNKQFLEYVAAGMEPSAAYVQCCLLFGVPVADDIEAAVNRLMSPATLYNNYERRQILDATVRAMSIQAQKGNAQAATALIRALNQIQIMVTNGASDEFAHLSNDELKRLAGEVA